MSTSGANTTDMAAKRQDGGPGRRELAKIEPKQVAVPAQRGAAPPPPPKPGKGWSARFPVALGILTLIVLVGGFGSWATFTQISGAVIASGQIEVESNRQVVQHPDGGVVESILVDEGDRVAAGDPLIRLDPKLVRSRLVTAESQLYEIQARRARLEAERDEADAIEFPDQLVAVMDQNEEVAELIEGQRRLFEARKETTRQQIDQLEGRREQIARQIEGITAQQTALEQQLALINEELTAQQSLLDRGLTQASQVLALRREDARLRGQVGELIANAGEAAERISEIDLQILSLNTQRREEAITTLRDLRFREVEYVETVATASEQLTRMVITAPVGGIVYNLSVFAERAVIRPADQVLFIVPQDRPLIIATRIEPIHVDQVQVGQEVTLRFSGFDQQTTPELTGEVRQVSADSFTDEQRGASFYRAEIGVLPGELDKLPEGLGLIPGMPVEAYLRTDDRTPIAYLVQPLTDYFTKAFRES